MHDCYHCHHLLLSLIWWRRYDNVIMIWLYCTRNICIDSRIIIGILHNTVKPVYSDRGCFIKRRKIQLFRLQGSYKSCLFYLWTATTCFERPPWRAVALDRFHCIGHYIIDVIVHQCFIIRRNIVYWWNTMYFIVLYYTMCYTQ